MNQSVSVALVILFLSSCAVGQDAFEAPPVPDVPLRPLGQIKQEREQLRRADRTREIETLTKRAAELRAEFDFETAKEVEQQIQLICFKLDPRLQRINRLKKRASNALLEGQKQDADMYNREADRVLQELSREFRIHSEPQSNDQNKDASTGREIQQLKQQIEVLSAELQSVMAQLRDRELQVRRQINR